jgi:CRISPR/Cas system type I-B associated protein Csh2 (Cas7 group RAMP superfamily)
VSKLVKRLFGKLFGDKGYLSQALFEQGVHLVTKLKRTMKNRLMEMSDKLWQRQRGNGNHHRSVEEHFAD